MALIKCEECSKEISDKASSCPSCGYKIAKSHNYKTYIIIGVVILVSIFVLIFGKKILYGKPSELSQKAYDYGIEALIVVDKYLDDVYDYDKAEDELDSIYKKIKSISETNDNTYDFLLSIDVLQVKSSMLIGTKTDVVESRNGLADTLNQRKR